MSKMTLCGREEKRCEACERWEPIPFHHRGGVCMAGDKKRAPELSIAALTRRAAKAGHGAHAVAAGSR